MSGYRALFSCYSAGRDAVLNLIAGMGSCLDLQLPSELDPTFPVISDSVFKTKQTRSGILILRIMFFYNQGK